MKWQGKNRYWVKILWAAVALYIVSAVIAAFSVSRQSKTNSTGWEKSVKVQMLPEKRILDNGDVASIKSNPHRYKGSRIAIKGQIFDIKKIKNKTYLILFADYRRDGQTFFVEQRDKERYKKGDFVLVKGLFTGNTEVKSPFSREKINMITAYSAKKLTSADDFGKVIKPEPVDRTITKKDVLVTLTKIEYTDDQTRVFLKVSNESGNAVYIDERDIKIVQVKKNYGTENYFDDYPEIEKMILPGKKSEGTCIFEAVDMTKSFRIVIGADIGETGETIEFSFPVR